MWPGYGDNPYFSPIIVRSVQPLGNRQFELDFVNVGYAAGVQQALYVMRTLKRGSNFLLAEKLDGLDSDRAIAIEPLTKFWLDSHFVIESTKLDRMIDSAGNPQPDVLWEAFGVTSY